MVRAQRVSALGSGIPSLTGRTKNERREKVGFHEFFFVFLFFFFSFSFSYQPNAAARMMDFGGGDQAPVEGFGFELQPFDFLLDEIPTAANPDLLS